MDAIRKVVGAYLIVMALVVGILGFVEPLIYESTEASPYIPWWSVIDWFTGAAVVLGVLFAYARKRAADAAAAGDAVTWTRLSANVLFYAFCVIGLLYYWNWFYVLNLEWGLGYRTVGADGLGIAWKLTDVSFPVAAGALGLALACGGDRRPRLGFAADRA